jgi:probable F420-dependent oxidoreductase
MHFGLSMFPTEYAIEPHHLAREAEARGFESLWFPEHTHIPASRRTLYPGGTELPKEYWHTFDPFGALCAAAVVTSTIKLATGICLLIERDTIITAKEAATVDRLSGGRFLFGIGAGWNAEEMEHHGTDFKTRFKKLKEQVLAVREIWTKEAAEFHGEFVRFDPIWCHPKPLQKPGPPIIVGGISTQAMDRAIAYGDGWMPLDRGGPEVLGPVIAEFDRRVAASGRPRASVPLTIFGAPQKPEALSRYEDLGAERAVLIVRPEPREVLLPKLDRVSKLISSARRPG